MRKNRDAYQSCDEDFIGVGKSENAERRRVPALLSLLERKSASFSTSVISAIGQINAGYLPGSATGGRGHPVRYH